MKAVPYARYAFNGVPVGTVIAYAGDPTNIPGGWLMCDGASLPQTDYPQLYAVMGSTWGTTGSSFNVPDLRGRFLRGADNGAGNDPEAATRTAINTGGNTGDGVGSLQGFAIQSHTHVYRATDAQLDNGINIGGSRYGIVQNRTSSPTGGSETRPKNATVNYIIKY